MHLKVRFFLHRINRCYNLSFYAIISRSPKYLSLFKRSTFLFILTKRAQNFFLLRNSAKCWILLVTFPLLIKPSKQYNNKKPLNSKENFYDTVYFNNHSYFDEIIK